MRSALALGFVFLGLAASVPASAQIQFPASWAGIWEISTTERVCETTPIIDQYTDTDTLCTGELFSADDETEFDCSGFIDDTSINISCSFDTTDSGCSITLAYSIVGSRSGDSFTGTEVFSITYSGCGPLDGTECTEAELSGTRIGAEPAACATPAVSATWGRIKATY